MPVLLPAIIAAGSVGGGLAAAGGVTAAGIASGLAGTAAVAGIGKTLLSKPSGGSVSQSAYDPQAEQKKAEDASRVQGTVRQNEMTKTVLNPLGGSGAMQQPATQRRSLLGV
jgi:hypothetical protein